MRFRPEQHLRRQSDFRAVREQGRRINCGAFTLGCLRREPAPASTSPAEPAKSALPRVGVVASTAAVGHAVLRNRAKRRLRAIFREHQALAPAGCDMLLTARNAATNWPFAELRQKFTDACAQLAPKEKP
jgi:ribonuclease P protein component